MAKQAAAAVLKHTKFAPAASAHQASSKPKKTVNINAIYSAPQSLKRKRRLEEEEEKDEAELEHRVPPASTRKPLVAEAGYFAKRAQEKERQAAAAPDPGFFKQFAKPTGFGFSDALKPYVDTIDATFDEKWTAFKQELQNRECGLDIDGKDLEVPVPSDADIDALRCKIIALGQPLEDDIMDVRTRQADGGSRLRQIRLGTTLNEFSERSEQAKVEIVTIGKKLRKVEREMANLKAELEREVQKGTGSDEFERDMRGFEEEIERIEQLAVEQRSKLDDNEKMAKREFKRKLNELMTSMIG